MVVGSGWGVAVGLDRRPRGSCSLLLWRLDGIIRRTVGKGWTRIGWIRGDGPLTPITEHMSETDTKAEAVHNGERIPVLRTIGEQTKELHGIERSVTCPCGSRRNVRSMFQCYYCEVWFCKECAGEHFNQE